MSLSEVLSGWMAVAIGPGSHAESFIWAATLCARRAGRSAEDRLLCKQEVLGSNPSRSTQVQAEGRPRHSDDRLVRGPREDVLVIVPRAPMVHRDEAFRHRPTGAVFEVLQISDARGRQVNPRPSDRRGGELVEPGRVSADRTAVVVATDRADLPIPQDLEDLVRPGVVAGQVARDPNPIRPDPIHVGEDRLQRRQARMDIREDGEAHRGPEGARPISASQYGARIVRQAVQREAESHDIWVRSLSPIGSPTMPKKLFLAYHWVPVGQFFAPTNPSSIGFPQFGHATIGCRKTSSDLRDKRGIPRRLRGPIHRPRSD